MRSMIRVGQESIEIGTANMIAQGGPGVGTEVTLSDREVSKLFRWLKARVQADVCPGNPVTPVHDFQLAYDEEGNGLGDQCIHCQDSP